MKKYLFPLLLGFCFISLSSVVNKAFAQSVTVQGKVTDAAHNPVHGVTVAEIDEDGRTIKADRTDVDGNFSLKVTNKNHKLSVSHISYKSFDVAIGDKTTFNLTLQSTSGELGEVVIVAQRRADNGMMSISERNLTTAQAHISAKELEEMQSASIDQALQGRLPGVDITAASGDPGAGMQIKIRGTSTINGDATPLIVVDGMPYETAIPSDFNFGTADDVGYASLLNIAPSDIADISILKDAAATAVWGSKAANGVVVITTKRGRVSKPVLTYTFKGSVTKQPAPLPMLNGDQYSTLIPEEYMNGIPTGIPLPQTTKEFQYDPNDPYWYHNYANNTDWLGAITQTGHTLDHNISMTGGGAKARYFASMDYFNQKGTTIGTNLDRISTRINLDYIVSEKIKIRSDLSYSYTNNDRNYATNLRDVAYRKMPNMSIYEYDEYGNNSGNYFSPFSNIQGIYGGLSSGKVVGTVNPVAMAKEASNNIISQRVLPHFNINYAILKNKLQATFDVQFDINNTKTHSFLPQTATGRLSTEPLVNLAYDGDLDGIAVDTKTNLIYTPQFKNQKHTLVTFLSFNTHDNKNTSHEEQTSNTASSILQDPSSPSRTNSTTANLQSKQSETRSLGLLLNGQYSFLDRYIINAGIRGDGNSRFGPANRYGLFPSISSRWRISGEPFFKPFTKSVDELSLRLSYGRSGKEPKNDYSYFSLYNALIGSSTTPFSYLGQGGVYPQSPALEDLRWETVIGRNLGVDLTMFHRRITLTLDFYKNTSKDLFFYGLTVPSFSGFDKIDQNGGSLYNQGFELGLNTTPYKSKNLQVDVNFNISSNQNVITEISPLYPSSKGDVTLNGNYESFLKINNPFGSFYGFKFKGVYKDVASTIASDANGKPIIGPNGQTVYMKFNYPSIGYTFQPGDAMYEDINHDGNINYQDVVYLGNSNPKFTGGFGSTVNYKGMFRLTGFFNYRVNYDIINGTKMTTTNMYGFDNQSTAVLRRWKKPGDETDMPRSLYRSGYNWLGSDRYVEDASFVRFRTLTLRYTPPKKFSDKIKLQNVSAYITVENLYVWTNYTGQDPEVSVTGSDPFKVARDDSYTPPARTFTLGLTASF